MGYDKNALYNTYYAIVIMVILLVALVHYNLYIDDDYKMIIYIVSPFLIFINYYTSCYLARDCD